MGNKMKWRSCVDFNGIHWKYEGKVSCEINVDVENYAFGFSAFSRVFVDGKMNVMEINILICC